MTCGKLTSATKIFYGATKHLLSFFHSPIMESDPINTVFIVLSVVVGLYFSILGPALYPAFHIYLNGGLAAVLWILSIFIRSFFESGVVLATVLLLGITASFFALLLGGVVGTIASLGLCFSILLKVRDQNL